MNALSLEERTKALARDRADAAKDAPSARLGIAVEAPELQRASIAAARETHASLQDRQLSATQTAEDRAVREAIRREASHHKADDRQQATPQASQGVAKDTPTLGNDKPIRDPGKHDFRPPGYSMGMGPTPTGAMIGTTTSRQAMLNEWHARRSHDASRGPDDDSTRGG